MTAATVRFNKREITIPFFVVGVEAFDLVDAIDQIRRVINAQRQEASK